MVVVTGMPGSGKGVAAVAAIGAGFVVFRMGDVVREEVRRRGLEASPENVGAVALGIRAEEGEAVVARRLLPAIEAEASGVVVIEGVRSLRELDELRRRFPVMTVAVHASPSTRFRRLVARGRSDAPESVGAFMERDRRELGFGIGELIAAADRALTNEGEEKKFQAEFIRILRSVESNTGS